MLAKSEPAANGRRGRSRSRSRGRQQPPPPPQKASNGRLQGSRRNQQLLNKLDKQHKMKLALNLKSYVSFTHIECFVFLIIEYF